MVSQTWLSPTRGCFSPRSSSHYYAIFWASSGSYPLPSTHRWLARLRERIVQWRPTSELLSTLSIIIGHGFFPWRSLPTITPKTPALATKLLNSIVDIILAFPMRKILISAQNQEPWKNYPPSFESWWPCASRSSIMLKNFKNKPIIKVSSHKAMSQAKKSGWVASISKPSRIAC